MKYVMVEGDILHPEESEDNCNYVFRLKGNKVQRWSRQQAQWYTSNYPILETDFIVQYDDTWAEPEAEKE